MGQEPGHSFTEPSAQSLTKLWPRCWPGLKSHWDLHDPREDHNDSTVNLIILQYYVIISVEFTALNILSVLLVNKDSVLMVPYSFFGAIFLSHYATCLMFQIVTFSVPYSVTYVTWHFTANLVVTISDICICIAGGCGWVCSQWWQK
jgi:hypothetical protein